MNWILAIIIGGLVGWAVNSTMRRQNVLTDVLVGMVGGLLGEWFFASILGIGLGFSAVGIALMGLVWGFVGSIILVAIVRSIMPEQTTTRRNEPTYYEEIRRKKEDDDKGHK